MGHADGSPPPQDPGRLPRMPRERPRRTSHTAHTMSTGEPDATENGQVRFGGGRRKRPCPGRDLAGGLPDIKSGSASGRAEKDLLNRYLASDLPVRHRLSAGCSAARQCWWRGPRLPGDSSVDNITRVSIRLTCWLSEGSFRWLAPISSARCSRRCPTRLDG